MPTQKNTFAFWSLALALISALLALFGPMLSLLLLVLFSTISKKLFYFFPIGGTTLIELSRLLIPFFCICSILLGHLSKKRIKNDNSSKEKIQSTIGLTVGYIILAYYISLYITVYLSSYLLRGID